MEQLQTGQINGKSAISCNGNQLTNGEIESVLSNGKSKGGPTVNGGGEVHHPTEDDLVVHVKSVQGRRRTMEDRFLVLNNFEPNMFGVETVLAVFDGHGGSDASQFCVDNFQSFFMRALASANDGTNNNKSHHSQGPNEKSVVTDSSSNNLNPKSSGEPTTSNKESSSINGANSHQLPFSSSSIHSSQLNTAEATGDGYKSNSNSINTNHQTNISDDSSAISAVGGQEAAPEAPPLLSTCLRNTFLAMDQAFAQKFPIFLALFNWFITNRLTSGNIVDLLTFWTKSYIWIFSYN